MSSQLKVNSIRDTSNNEALTISSGNVSFNNTISAGTLGSSVTGNWGWKLLQTETISSAVSNKDIGSSSLFSSTYDTYKIIFHNLGVASDIGINCQLSIDTGFVTSGSHYDYTARAHRSDGNVNQGASNAADAVDMVTQNVFGDDNESGYNRAGMCGEITIPNPAETGIAKFIFGYASYMNSTGYTAISTFTGGFGRDGGSATHRKPITGVRFQGGGGSVNLSRGTIRLYGVINA
tara:strand:- start:2266 stop:2970 length:705 start_codon:yes stop_codon:yes gene_type:complete